MKPTYLILLTIAVSFFMSSCDDSNGVNIENPEELEGIWFLSYPNKVWGGHDQPSFERGETHFRVTFKENGEFIHSRTVLGIYEGTTINDTSAIVIESGTYSADGKALEIILDKRLWWDAFYDNMDDFEESGVEVNKFHDATYKIKRGDLKLTYYTATDFITDDQEIRGFDKFEREFVKE